MTHDLLGADRLLSKLVDSKDVDLVRELVGHGVGVLIEAEVSAVIGAGWHERSDASTNLRNGGRSRLLSTKAGDVELRIPKLREGNLPPALLEPRRRVEQTLYASAMETYVHGVSTRKVDDLVSVLGVDAGISTSEVSRIRGEMDSSLRAFRERPLDHCVFPLPLLGRHLSEGPGERTGGEACRRRGDQDHRWRGP